MIRRIDSDDYPAMATIHRASFDVAWDEKQIEDLCRTGAVGFIDIRGSFLLVRSAADECEILTLAVLPALRRQGMAAALLEALDDFAKAHHINSLLLEVSAENHTAFVLYEKCGYQFFSRRKNYYLLPDGKRVDALMMRKEIG